MPKSIAVCGAGPALGQAVARRYAREGYAVTLVARRPGPLERMAGELASSGVTVRAIAADLADTGAVARLAERIRAAAGHPDVLYYGPSAGGSRPMAELTPERLATFMGATLYPLMALTREFLPHMIEQGHGAVLLATGASAVRGLPRFSGAGPALAAQRNYLQSLHAELAATGVYAGGLYIGATIEHSAWHAKVMADAAAEPARARGPVVSPAYLADLLWTMQHVSRPLEVLYPEDVFSR
jgi:short-subunit dehydrogenase